MEIGNKVLRHPEKDEIIAKLTSGDSVKDVEKWLKKRHPKSVRLQVSYMTLQKFRKEYLNIEGEVLDSIKQARGETNRTSKQLERRSIVVSSDAYQRKLDEIVSNELDVTRKMLEMEKLIGSRLEFYYNILSAGGSLKEEKMFLELLNSQRALMADWKKYVEGVADHTVEHNININVVNEQVNVLKSIVYEVLQEIDPNVIPLFVEKINARFGGIQYGDETYKKQIEVIDVE